MTNDSGRILLHDPQSWNYQYPRKFPAFGSSVRHTMAALNVDQFYTSGCVGFSATNMLNCSMAVRSRQRFNECYRLHKAKRYLDNQDGLVNYSNATKFDPFDWTYPPVDEGSSALGLMKFWKMLGVIRSYDWTFTFNGFLAALQQQPVLVGTNWYDGMTYPADSGIVYPYGQSVGGHEYLATAILWDRKLISFENSWGEGWGFHGGRFFMHFADAERLIIDEGGDCAVPRFL